MLTAAAAEPAPLLEPPPSAELLMYLGEFEDASGDFVDPMALEDTPASEPPGPQPNVKPDHDEKSDEPAPQSA